VWVGWLPGCRRASCNVIVPDSALLHGLFDAHMAACSGGAARRLMAPPPASTTRGGAAPTAPLPAQGLQSCPALPPPCSCAAHLVVDAAGDAVGLDEHLWLQQRHQRGTHLGERGVGGEGEKRISTCGVKTLGAGSRLLSAGSMHAWRHMKGVGASAGTMCGGVVPASGVSLYCVCCQPKGMHASMLLLAGGSCRDGQTTAQRGVCMASVTSPSGAQQPAAHFAVHGS
jgi:hypothetical protein